jgi:hypothetical protein
MSLKEKAWHIARAISVNPSERAIRLLLQLFGVAPCSGCGYLKSSCRCNQKRRVPSRPWTKFCRGARAERLSRMERLG